MRWAVLARVQRSHILAPISYLTKVVGFGGLTAMGLLMGLVLLMMVRLRQEMTKVRQSHAELERRVTEAREHVRTQQQQLIQSSKLASLGQLSAGVAHELNNPLNNINLLVLNALDQVDVELKGRQLQHPLHEKLEAAAEQVQRATGVINNLRTFARASGTSMHAIVLADAIDSATALLRETLRLQQVELSIHMADRKAEVWGDRLQIEQVLVNLLTNACDALNDAAVKRIMITAEADEDWELVTVTDTGHGIAPQTLPHIFDPFFTTKEVGRGTGLGLSIVYGIIQDHGGQITAQSTPGKGTQIQLRFPRKRDGLPDLEVQTGAPY
jgi:two-component system C4-dicarboxylate transport sensor histidine kinase DctB